MVIIMIMVDDHLMMIIIMIMVDDHLMMIIIMIIIMIMVDGNAANAKRGGKECSMTQAHTVCQTMHFQD